MVLTSDEQWMEANDHLLHHPDDHDAVVSKIASPCSSSSMKLMTSKNRTVSNSKPVIAKQRSRASRKTPVTLLHANASNFRDLVQQFTGCPTTPLSLGVPFKGPITLNFRRGTREMQIHHNRSSATTRPSSSTDNDNQHNNSSSSQVLHVRFHHQNYQRQFLRQQQIQSQVSDLGDFDIDEGLHEEQPIINVDDDDYTMVMEKTSTGDIIVEPSGDSSSGVSSSSSSGLEASHLADFDGLMDDFSLHDLIDMNNAFSNDLGYFV